MAFFNEVPLAPSDSIFRLNTAFKRDSNPYKINLGVGAYKTEELKPWVLPSVLEAERLISKLHLDKEYLPIEGDAEYIFESAKLVFGEDFVAKEGGKIFGAQTIGGTGALRIGSEFVARYGVKKIYIPSPTWPNHQQVFSAAGLHVEMYPYYDEVNFEFRFPEMCKAIENMEPGATLLLQACCHNPTGVDPTKEQWTVLIQKIKERGLLPFFDSAYQGFAEGIEEDAFAIREFAKHFNEMIVASSYSKNFGLYSERIGALFFLVPNEECALHLGSQVKVLIRANYSNPPSHGARIVKTILTTPALKHQWVEEVTKMRSRLVDMRTLLVQKLKEKAPQHDFTPLSRQHGMFSFCGLNGIQVDKLVNTYGIYMTSNGRISIAGLSKNNLDYVVDAISTILS